MKASTIQILKEIYNALGDWRPVIFRGGLYCFIAFMTPFVATIEKVGTTVVLNSWTWADWLLLWGECTLASALTLRIYIDSSFKQLSDDLKANKTTAPSV